MDYGKLLGRAWRITWDHRLLWLFGLLAGLSFRFNVSRFPPESQQWLEDIATGDAVFGPIYVGLLVLPFLVGLLFLVLSSLGRAALIDQVNHIEDGGGTTVGSGWQAARRYVWRVLLVYLLLCLPLVVILLAGLTLLLPIIREAGLPEGAPSDVQNVLFGCFTPVCCLGGVLGILISIIGPLAQRACVLEDQTVWRGIRSAWELLRGNPGPVVLLWLVLLGERFGTGLVLAIPICLLMAPLVSLSRAPPPAGIAWFCGYAIVAWVVWTALASVVETFLSTSWTLGFRELRAMRGVDGTAEEAP
jgi:hypothetical protein